MVVDEKMQEYAKRVVAQAPPLTSQQRKRLTELLAPVRRSASLKAA